MLLYEDLSREIYRFAASQASSATLRSHEET